jgi:hypothetical protein
MILIGRDGREEGEIKGIDKQINSRQEQRKSVLGEIGGGVVIGDEVLV